MDLVGTPEAGKIGPTQAGMMLIALVFPISVLYAPVLHIVVSQAGRDSWFSILLATVAAIVVLGGTWLLSLRHPGRTFFQILEIEWGPWVGRTVAGLYLMGAAVHGALLVRAFSEGLGFTILPRTPVLVIAGAQVMVAVFAARRGIEVLARINQVATPLMLVSLVALFSLAWSDFQWLRLSPALQTPTEDILRGAVWPLGWFLQATVMAQMVFPFVVGPRKVAGPLLLSVLVVGIFMTAAVLVSTAVLGVHEAVHSLGLIAKLAREVRPVEFLSRTEALYLFFWQAAAYVEITAVLYRGALEGAQLFGLRAYQSLVAPMGLVVVLAGSVLFRSLPDLVRFAQQVFPVYAILLGGVVPLLLLAFSRRPRPVGDDGPA